MATKSDALVPWVQVQSRDAAARGRVRVLHDRDASSHAATQSEQGRTRAKAAAMGGTKMGAPASLQGGSERRGSQKNSITPSHVVLPQLRLRAGFEP